MRSNKSQAGKPATTKKSMPKKALMAKKKPMRGAEKTNKVGPNTKV
jgi:hypothetical protein